MPLGMFDSLREGVYSVIISRSEALSLLNQYHYLRGCSSASKTVGSYLKGELIGVVVFANPISESVRERVFGEEHKDIVVELQRLCLIPDCPVPASKIVSQSIEVLNKWELSNSRDPYKAIISFADTRVGHHGGVYQAMSWLYCGESHGNTGFIYRDQEGVYRTRRNNGVNLTHQQMIDMGWDVIPVDKVPKHRYIKILGSKREKKRLRKLLKLEVLPYPKPDQDSP